MTRNRSGSGSIPPEQRLDPNTVWVMLVKYIPAERRCRPFLLLRASADDFPGGRAAFTAQTRELLSLEEKLRPYLKRLPEDLSNWIGLAASCEEPAQRRQLLEDAQTDFLAWFYKTEK